MAKLVTIKVFEYDELPKPLRENIFERVRDGIIDDNFEAFPEIACEYLAERYGIDAKVIYSLSYCQGDGLRFHTDHLMTDEIIEMVKAKLDEEHKTFFTEHQQDMFSDITTHSSNRYAYAHRNDVKFNNFSGYDGKQGVIVDNICTAIEDIYLHICSELEDIGYSNYDIPDEQVNEIIHENMYYSDGSIYYEEEE